MSKARELAELGAVYNSGALSNRNVIINGAMDVAQRGTSSTGVGGASGYFTVDRFSFGLSSSGRFTVTQESDGPSGFANCTKLACTTADTSIASTESLSFRQIIEGQNLQRFAKGTSDAKEFTVSFYVKGNAAATYTCELYDADNSRQISKTFSVTTAWTRVTLTFPADTTGAFADDNGISLYLNVWLHAGSDYNGGTLNSSSWASAVDANRVSGSNTSFYDSTSRTFFITGVQLEVGTEATPFEHRQIGDELLRCKRYFEVYAPVTNDDGSLNVWRTRTSVNNYNGIVYFLEKRAQPTCTLDYDRLHKPGVAKDTLSNISVTIGSGQTSSCAVNCTPDNDSTISTSAFLGKNSGTAKLSLDAEL